MSDSITHNGRISKVSESSITVSIVPVADECSKCAIASLCSKSEDIVIPYSNPSQELIGSEVTVAAPGGMRLKATVLFLLAPMIILILALALSLLAGLTEGVSAIVAIAAVALWYLALYAMRIKFRQEAVFTIKSIK